MEEPSIKKNYIYDTLYHGMTFFIPLITAPYLSRILGPDGVGTFSYLVSIQTYFSMFTALGTITYGARAIAQNRDNQYEISRLFWEIEILTIAAAGVTLSAWLGLIIYLEEYRWYLTALTMCILGTVFDISWFFSGLEQYKYIALRNTFFKFLGLILLFIFVKSEKDLLYYFIVYSLTALLSGLSMWIKIRKFIVPIKINELHIKLHFKETLVYFIPTIATSIYTVLDKTLIGLITKESVQNGYYEQANQIINIAKTVTFGSMNTVIGTRLSYLFAKNQIEEAKDKIEQSFDFVFLIGFGCLFGILGVAHTLVPLYFGKRFEPVEGLLYILAPIIIIISISACLGSQYYIPAGKRAQSAKYLILGSIVNLILNIFLIPLLKAKGASMASVIAELFIAGMYIRNCDGFFSIRKMITLSKYKIIAGGLMFTVIKFLMQFLPAASQLLYLVLQVICGMGVYLVLLFILKDTSIIKLKMISGRKYGRKDNSK